ncbi:MAG: pitrilysin family protein [Gammaproteobacteria bacterium]
MRHFFWILSLIMLSITAHANPITTFQLPNGLKLFVQEDHRAPVAVVQVWYKVGSSYETAGTTGIAHALEHMMFKGTHHFGPGQFSQIVADIGGQNNAFTDRDYTAYYEILDANKLPISFELEADRMRNLNLDPEEFKKEIQVVMEERRMRTEDNPQMVTYERFLAAAHVANPYHHLPIGWMNDLQHMTIQDLQHWYQQWYAPNNALVVVVGDVKPEDVHQLALKYFGPLKPSQMPVLKPQAEVASLGERNIIVKIPAQVPWLIVGYNVPVIKTAVDPHEPYILAVIEGILTNGNSGRLTQNLVRGQQIAADISVDYDPYARLDTIFSVDATPAEGHTTAELKAAILNEVQALQTQTVSEGELKRVKAGVIADKIYSQDSIEDEATQIGSLEAVGLPWQLRDEFVKQISAVTPAQIQAVAKKYLIADNMTVAELQPLPLQEGSKPTTASPTGSAHVH